ncbi:MAG: T9SS type A sorting domain-containing protein [Gemmatimonadetes bacterium]|nr:T9SS type A sorting domain-containing protein [Gemmatimonadota bacterium]
MCRFTGPAIAVLALALSPRPGLAGSGDWNEDFVIRDGLYNNAARVAYDPMLGAAYLAYKHQVGTSSPSRQIAVAARADQSPPLWTPQDITANTSSKEYPDLVVGDDGVTHVVWREDLGGGNWQVRYTNDRGGSFTPPISLTSDLTVKGSPVITARGLNDVVHIAYSTLETGTANDEIWYLRYDTVAQTSQFRQITNDTISDDDASIAVSPDGNVVSIAWAAGGSIRCVEGDIAGFTDVPTGVAASASQPDLAVDWSGPQHIAYRHAAGGGISIIRTIARNGAGFEAPVDVSNADANYSQPSLIVAPQDLVTVVFVTNTAGRRGFYGASPPPVPDPQFPIWQDESVTFNETDLALNPIMVTLPGPRALQASFAVVSAGYVEADTVRADLHLFAGLVAATAAPDLLGDAAPVPLEVAPNPFRSATRVSFVLREAAADVTLDVYDVAGRRRDRSSVGPRGFGPQSVSWDGSDLPAGVYWLRLTAGAQRQARRVQILR